MSASEVVLVTGSSGFLGQHVIKLLQENEQKIVGEIRCLDVRPFKQNLTHKLDIPMKHWVGSVLNEKLVQECVKGVDTVIHCAAVIDVSLKPNEELLRSVNIDGTRVLVEASIDANVKRFIHISTADCVMGYDPIYYGAENTTPIPKKFVLGPYAETKRQAELIVQKANGRVLDDGTKFMTAMLRPTVIYGEEDVHFITKILRSTKNRKGTLQRIDNVFIRLQPTYVGNVAWAVLKLKEKLKEDESIGGEEFFITDETQILDPFEFLRPYVESRDMKVSKRTLPYWFVLLVMYLMILGVKLFGNLIGIKELPEDINPSGVRYLCNTYFFNRNKATLRLDYEPLYSHDESQQNSLEYYSKVEL